MKKKGNNPKPLLLTNIGQLLTLRAAGSSVARRGQELKELALIQDAAALCADGKIVAAGKQREILRHPARKKFKFVELDCGQRVALPGFVDSHTHPVFAAPRLLDFERRIAGASYEDIAAAGGGIRSSVDAVRKASRKQLAQFALNAFEEMAHCGTTTIEAKSGYGLSVEAEIKSLEGIRDAAAEFPGTVVPTLLGAHVVPSEFRNKPEKYLRQITGEMIPRVARKKLARFVDVFIERGAFCVGDAEQIFEMAKKYSLGVRAHVCQLSANEVWPLLRFAPASLDHMDYVNDEEIPQLAKHHTIATLVPGANYFLGLNRFPPARKLIDAGVPVALATDFNPGSSPTSSMQFVLSLACTQMQMSPAEAIAAATINGAYALSLADRKGSIEENKDADLAIFDVKDYCEIAYWFGGNKCWKVILNGMLGAND